MGFNPSIPKYEGGKVVKSKQRGVFKKSSGTKTIAITHVDSSKCLINFYVQHLVYGGDSCYYSSPRLVDFSDEYFTVIEGYNGDFNKEGLDSITITYEIIEFY